MQKINVAKKLVALSLMVLVSGSAVASAQAPKRGSFIWPCDGENEFMEYMREENELVGRLLERQLIAQQAKTALEELMSIMKSGDYESKIDIIQGRAFEREADFWGRMHWLGYLVPRCPRLHKFRLLFEQLRADAGDLVDEVRLEEFAQVYLREQHEEPRRRNYTPVGPSVFLQNGTVFELGATAQDTLRNLIRTMSPQTVSQVMREFSGQN